MRFAKICQLFMIANFTCTGTALYPLLGQEPSPIREVGRMVDIPGAHETPNPSLDYKIVFDLNSAADKADEMNPGLTTVAALVNTFSHYNVGPLHRHFVVIFHGKTVDLVMKDDAYRRTHEGHANPNIELMRELSAAGVQLVVCGQSALQHQIDLKTIQPIVQLNLSATVTLMNLETEGYVRIEEWRHVRLWIGTYQFTGAPPVRGCTKTVKQASVRKGKNSCVYGFDTRRLGEKHSYVHRKCKVELCGRTG